HCKTFAGPPARAPASLSDPPHRFAEAFRLTGGLRSVTWDKFLDATIGAPARHQDASPRIRLPLPRPAAARDGALAGNAARPRQGGEGCGDRHRLALPPAVCRLRPWGRRIDPTTRRLGCDLA